MESRQLKVAIVGAGASGIAAAVRLHEAGVTDFTVYEKAGDVGGTWRDNVYPGLTCDVPSHLYRYSFAPNAEWTHEYADGPQIHEYLRGVARQKGIFDKVRFNSEVVSATFDKTKKTWLVRCVKGDEIEYDVVIAAMGVLHREVYPDIPGRDSFRGIAFHSSKWDREIDLRGKRVGIIGAGSTAVQIMPAIVDEVDSVSLFMRTPQWIVPVENAPIPEEKKRRFRSDPSAMADLYDFLAERFNHRFAAALVGDNPEGLENIKKACEDNLEANIADPELRRRLRPDYAVGCKRLVVSNKFYPAIQKSNAHLVDTKIKAIEQTGIRTVDGILHELDVIVYATGFDPFNFFKPMTVFGLNGQELGQQWEKSSQALRSVSVPGFPNFFFLGGPNSPIGNFSFIMTAETQLGYVMGLIDLLREGVRDVLVPTREATAAFNSQIEAAMKDTIWVTGGCHSWYFDKAGKVASWPWTYARFEQDLKSPKLDEFECH